MSQTLVKHQTSVLCACAAAAPPRAACSHLPPPPSRGKSCVAVQVLYRLWSAFTRVLLLARPTFTRATQRLNVRTKRKATRNQKATDKRCTKIALAHEDRIFLLKKIRETSERSLEDVGAPRGTGGRSIWLVGEAMTGAAGDFARGCGERSDSGEPPPATPPPAPPPPAVECHPSLVSGNDSSRTFSKRSSTGLQTELQTGLQAGLQAGLQVGLHPVGLPAGLQADFPPAAPPAAPLGECGCASNGTIGAVGGSDVASSGFARPVETSVAAGSTASGTGGGGKRRHRRRRHRRRCGLN